MTVGFEEARLARQLARVELNREIRSVAADAAEEYEFVCECGEPGCEAHLQLSLLLFDSLERDGVGLLAEGHQVSVARAARRNARDLRESARALQGRSHLQVDRSRRLRRDPVLIVVRVPTVQAASDLASHFEHAVISNHDDDVAVAFEALALGSTLSDVRDWACRHGLASVDVSFRGTTRTLIADAR